MLKQQMLTAPGYGNIRLLPEMDVILANKGILPNIMNKEFIVLTKSKDTQADYGKDRSHGVTVEELKDDDELLKCEEQLQGQSMVPRHHPLDVLSAKDRCRYAKARCPILSALGTKP